MPRRLGWFGIVLVGAVTAGCGWSSDAAEPPPTKSPPTQARAPMRGSPGGRVLDWNDVVDGQQRVAKVSMPPGYDGTSKLPMVLALHGGGGDIQTMMEKNGWKATLDKEGWIGIYPKTGRVGREGGEASDDGDLDYYEALLDRAFKELPVDRSRVFVVGFSAGGRGTYLLANRRFDDLTAVAAASASVRRTSDPPSLTDPVTNKVHDLSLLHIHGKADTRVPWEGGPIKREEGVTQEEPPAEGLARWTEALNARKAQGPKPLPGRPDRLKAQRWVADDGHVVQVVVDPQLSHAWAPWANDVIMEFFKAAPPK